MDYSLDRLTVEDAQILLNKSRDQKRHDLNDLLFVIHHPEDYLNATKQAPALKGNEAMARVAEALGSTEKAEKIRAVDRVLEHLKGVKNG